MKYRFLGRSGLQVSAISLGGWLTYGGHVDRGRWELVEPSGDAWSTYVFANDIFKRAPLPV